MNTLSDRPILRSVDRIDGQVPSPTPIVGTVGDSTSVTVTVEVSNSAASIPAVSQPAVPPPSITMCCGDGFISGD